MIQQVVLLLILCHVYSALSLDLTLTESDQGTGQVTQDGSLTGGEGTRDDTQDGLTLTGQVTQDVNSTESGTLTGQVTQDGTLTESDQGTGQVTQDGSLTDGEGTRDDTQGDLTGTEDGMGSDSQTFDGTDSTLDGSTEESKGVLTESTQILTDQMSDTEVQPVPTRDIEYCLPIPSDWTDSIQFRDGDVELFYKVNIDAGTVSMSLAAKHSGWVGIGISEGDKPQMIGSQAVSGWIHNGRPFVAPWNLNAKKKDQVVIDTNTTISDYGVCFESGFTVLTFTREISTWPIRISEGKNESDSQTPVVIAFGPFPETTEQLTYHDANNIRGFVDFSTGEAATYIDYKRVIHAVAMGLGWFLLHIGALYARFGKGYPHSTWLIVHRVLQIVGFTIALGGFAFIIILRFAQQKAHFNEPLFHGQAGLVVMCFATIQVALAFFRPSKEENGEGSFIRKAWELKHHIFGRISLLGAVAVIGVGIYNLTNSLDNIYFGAFCGITLCIGLLAISLEFGNCCTVRVTNKYQMIKY